MVYVLISALVVRLLTDVCFKLSVQNIKFDGLSSYSSSFKKVFTSIPFLIAIFISGINFWLWIIVLSHYDLSFAYPFFGVCFALIMLMGKLFFGEQLDYYKVVGIIFILLSTLVLIFE